MLSDIETWSLLGLGPFFDTETRPFVGTLSNTETRSLVRTSPSFVIFLRWLAPRVRSGFAFCPRLRAKDAKSGGHTTLWRAASTLR